MVCASALSFLVMEKFVVYSSHDDDDDDDDDDYTARRRSCWWQASGSTGATVSDPLINSSCQPWTDHCAGMLFRHYKVWDKSVASRRSDW